VAVFALPVKGLGERNNVFPCGLGVAIGARLGFVFSPPVISVLVEVVMALHAFDFAGMLVVIELHSGSLVCAYFLVVEEHGRFLGKGQGYRDNTHQ
jgi:hypothetical protein